jgi:hypothetical protein
MSIQLDWEIEAEHTHVQRGGEDPEAARRRRRARIRILLFLLIVLGLMIAIVAFVSFRLQAVDSEIEQALRNTVDAEVAALRLGDLNAFLVTQRSASADWIQQQTQFFNHVQDLKTTQNIQLSGEISAVEVDKTRARVAVQEILNGVPFTRLWFYWRYEDGWRHVPPDYTFWGESITETRDTITVHAYAVDAAIASTAADSAAAWLQTACAILTCTAPPVVGIEIIPDPALQTGWTAPDSWVLQMPSPYVNAARSDQPFDTEMQVATANALAERMIAAVTGTVPPIYPADAYYLRQGLVSWLVGRFVQINTNAFVINSLAANYGDAAVGRLAASLLPDSSVALLTSVTGVSQLAQANLDWRDFLTWRLVTEDDLIRKQDEGNFLNLYDTRDSAVRDLAYQRFTQPPTDLSKVVVSAQVEAGLDGTPLLRATAEIGEGDSAAQIEVRFSMVDGVWKRAN